ncbi:MAG: hypothetical protein WAO61_04910 [Solirubrobacterales bacterium]
MAAIGACGWNIQAAFELKERLPGNLPQGGSPAPEKGRPADFRLLQWDRIDTDETRLDMQAAMAQRHKDRRRERGTDRPERDRRRD